MNYKKFFLTLGIIGTLLVAVIFLTMMEVEDKDERRQEALQILDLHCKINGHRRARVLVDLNGEIQMFCVRQDGALQEIVTVEEN